MNAPKRHPMIKAQKEDLISLSISDGENTLFKKSMGFSFFSGYAPHLQKFASSVRVANANT
ncbi:MAG: hypothetical protein EAZ70_00680 [Runella slithyformis]|nr:MAG: hypothetical protein EAY79_01075 [Runella slithyformis]TAF29808.1 MAG: hypothetical protein EAZ70_00680 [Runella slithyformis]TAF48841.1 MAG: hypothetical protein EAZ63_03270 [Runella slithyformis]TAF83424.1 MAG: hypothetical protein EAZ50_01220 [Runella slithyformis]